MPYTSHGHWFGPGEPTLPAPDARARCGGPGMCRVCSKEANPLPQPGNPPQAEQVEYACRFTAWTLDGARERRVTKYDYTGTGDSGLQEARRVAADTRAWQPGQDLPVDAVVVSRPVVEWTEVPDAG